MFLGIRKKLIGIMSIIGIVSVLLIGIATYIHSSDMISENFIESNTELNAELSESIEKEFAGFMGGLNMVAVNDNTKTIPVDGFNEWRRNVFKAYNDSFPEVVQTFIGMTDGAIYIEPDFKFEVTYDPRSREWYKGAQAAKGPYWTGAYRDKVSGKYTVASAIPVQDKSGTDIGVVGASIDLEVLSKKIDEIKVGKRGYVFLLDDKGTTIVHPNKALIGQPFDNEKVMEALQNQTEGIVYYDYADVDGELEHKYAVYEKIEGLNWYILTSMYVNEAQEQASTLITFTVIAAVGVFLLTIVIAFLFARSFTKPIDRLVKDMEIVANGDMTIQSGIQTRDEIGILAKSFNTMTESIRHLMLNVDQASQEVSGTAERLAGSSEEASASSEEVSRAVSEIAEGATEQAQDAEEASLLAANLEEKFTDLRQKADDISQHAGNVKTINEESIRSVEDLRCKTEENNQATQNIQVAIEDLTQKTSAIGGILDTIRSISEQTNLLALNASIEAARAGEHGKGFAVVADEIRKLAEESSQSAEEIQKIVQMIQGQTHSTLNIMGHFSANAEAQYASVGQVNQSFANILSAVEEITTRIHGMHGAIVELNKDKDNIVHAISNISSVSEETAAASEEVSASMDQQAQAVEAVAESAEQLNSLSIQLRNELEKFKI